MNEKKIVQIACGFLGMAVLIGAFGAHGMKEQLAPAALATFKTGVTYHFYHGFAIMLAALLQKSFEGIDLKRSVLSFSFGIFLFAGNCYLYAMTQMKFFALLVPIGGLAFIIGWCFMLVEFRKKVR